MLELGDNDPTIVLDEADPAIAKVANGINRATERLLLQASAPHEVAEMADQVMFAPLNGREVPPEYGHPERADPGEPARSESFLQSNPGCES